MHHHPRPQPWAPWGPLTGLAAMLAVAIWVLPEAATAQVAGSSTTLEASVTESTTLAMGWSVKKTLLGQKVYNSSSQVVGKVEDLIVSPDRSVTYVIVGAGGFVGIGRHDVAVPVAQIRDTKGRLVMAGATPASVKQLPAFQYATDNSRRDRFTALANADIAKGRSTLATLEKNASTAGTEARAALNLRISALQGDLKSAEATLADMQRVSASRWREFEDDVGAATARVRLAVEKAV